MGDSSGVIQHKLHSANDLKSVVRTMKAMAAVNITQYENAVHALDDYYHTVQLGLLGYFHHIDMPAQTPSTKITPSSKERGKTGIIIIGSDQGLVGQFNDVLLAFMSEKIATIANDKLIWAVGERIYTYLEDSQYMLQKPLVLPNTIGTVTSLVTELLQEIHRHQQTNKLEEVYLFFNHSALNAQYEPTCQRILPLDNQWQQLINAQAWPTKCIPELLTAPKKSFSALIGEYLFASLFRAATQSLASENASRLTSMQRAEKNIDELQTLLLRQFHRYRQGAIDEELSDLVSGFEALGSAD